MSWLLKGPSRRLEPREWFAGPDHVELALAGDVAAMRYVEPRRLLCTAARVMLRRAPAAHAEAVSELLFGEAFDIVDVKDGFALGRCGADSYIGWAPFDVLALPDPRHAGLPDQIVTARRAPLFAQPGIKAPIVMMLPYGARLRGERAGDFIAVPGAGYVHHRHLTAAPADRFAVAALFGGAPYVWGGRSADGCDCSGLVQAALAAEGIRLRRDTDLQLEQGEPVPFAHRSPGDLVFFPGHVGLLLAGDRLCHANAHWMAVVTEPLEDVIARLHDTPEPVKGVRRFGV